MHAGASLEACTAVEQKAHKGRPWRLEEEGCFPASLPLSSCCWSAAAARLAHPAPPSCSERALLAGKGCMRIKGIAQHQLCCQAELCSAENSAAAERGAAEPLGSWPSTQGTRSSCHTALGHAGGCLAVAPNSSFLLSSQVRSFILRTPPHLMHLPIPNASLCLPPYCETSSVSLLLCPLAGSPTALQSPHRARAGHWEWVHLELSSSGHHHSVQLHSIADRSQTRQSQAFSWTERNYRTTLGPEKFSIPDQCRTLFCFLDRDD